MEITKDIVYLGVNDHAVDLFESQYSVPNGMAYNSYLIMDDQTVVMDTVDAHFTDEWITKIAAALGDRAPDYLVVQHMEPDHAGSIDAFAQAYPTTKIVSSAKAFVMMQQFFGTDYADRRIVVKEGDTLPLGHHTLHFVTAPMVHWPEVIMTYDDADKVLFSADAFGKFGALDAQTRAQLQEDLLGIWAQEKKTCLFITHDVEEAVLLATKVVIMSARPGRIKSIIDIDLPYPRDQATKLDEKFIHYKNMIWESVYKDYLEVQK